MAFQNYSYDVIVKQKFKNSLMMCVSYVYFYLSFCAFMSFLTLFVQVMGSPGKIVGQLEVCCAVLYVNIHTYIHTYIQVSSGILYVSICTYIR